jgi:hypothetical protein
MQAEEVEQPNGTRRRTTPRVSEFGMDDLRRRLDAQDHITTGIRGDMTIQATAMQGIQKELASLAGSVTTLVSAIGDEKEDGQGNYLGTGLLGRVRRVERSQRSLRELYHRWIAFGAGFCACFGTAVALIWWLVGDKIGLVLKGTGHG